MENGLEEKKIEARKKAAGIIKKLKLEAPIEFKHILDAYKIDLFLVDSLKDIVQINEHKDIDWNNVWGAIENKGKDECKIFILNSIKYKNSKRFTLAHELGHFFIDFNEGKEIGSDVYLRDKLEPKPLEHIYDEFAINLLIPDYKIFIDKWYNNKTDSELANFYGVPIISIAIYKNYLLKSGKLYG